MKISTASLKSPLLDCPATAASPTSALCSATTPERLLTAFLSAASSVPAYRTLLAEHAVNVAEVTDAASFSRLCPILSKANTFERFAIGALSAGGRVSDLGDVLTSSGRGGRFSFGVSTRTQMTANVGFLDDAFDAAFGVKSRSTLAVNCLPMGVVFSSNVMTLATTSVREDMAVALVETFGDEFEQILLVGDPLFLKRLTDYAKSAGLDWSRYCVHAVIGEEIFGECYRDYLATCLRADDQRPERGYIMSSFGVGELGLHLGYETRATIALRRAAHDNPELATALFGVTRTREATLPMLFAFNPQRLFLEIVEPDGRGYGAMTFSMLDSDRRIPLLRYQTGDVGALLAYDRVVEVIQQFNVAVPGPLPPALFALAGRRTEELPNGGHVGTYKDALYAQHAAAESLTGAMRLVFNHDACTMHVQLTNGAARSATLEQEILKSLPSGLRPERLVVWPYSQFPFGMGLDYERKFAYYVAGEADRSAVGTPPD